MACTTSTTYLASPTPTIASLIGSVGGTDDPFFVGSSTSYPCERTGTLYLGINDIGVANNSGAFVATVVLQHTLTSRRRPMRDLSYNVDVIQDALFGPCRAARNPTATTTREDRREPDEATGRDPDVHRPVRAG